MPFIPSSDQDREQMLNTIGVKNFDELVKSIPESVKFKGELNLLSQLSEYEVEKLLKKYASKNISTDTHLCFMGGGAYDRFIPHIVPSTIDRPEFRTAYTPYQAEVSQGTLQAMYEFQSMICELTKMEIANASLYDGASSLAEACLMANAENKRTEIVFAGTVHPNYIEVVKTICYGKGLTFKVVKNEDGSVDLDKLNKVISDKTAAVIIQQPNFYGNLEDVYEVEKITHSIDKTLFIVVADITSLAIIDPPGNYNADVVVGEGQGLGISLSYGGPYLGIFACKEKYIRKLPGRIAGMTVDQDGKKGFVLTLQTREQQIKREKATSNICTNQGLFMLAATIYMETMGREGLKDVATNSYQNAHYLQNEICKINGFSLASDKSYLHEFCVKTPVDPQIIIDEGVENGFLAGINTKLTGDKEMHGLLIAVTEKRNKEEMDSFVEFLKKFAKEEDLLLI
jgi:glycine dehydrogenase subunit 1